MGTSLYLPCNCAGGITSPFCLFACFYCFQFNLNSGGLQTDAVVATLEKVLVDFFLALVVWPVC